MTSFWKGWRPRLKPDWAFDADGVLWRLHVTASGIVVGEDRITESRATSFFAIRIDTGEVLWKALKAPEPWWVGIEASHRHVLFLHEFRSPDLPAHKKIHAIDLNSGNPLWSNDELEYLFSVENLVVGARDAFEGREYLGLDLNSGEDRGNISQSEIDSLRANLNEAALYSLPETLPLDGEDGQSLIRSGGLERERVAYVEYARHKENVILAYYQISDPSSRTPLFDAYLSIIDQPSAKVMFKEHIDRNAKGLVPDTFLVWNDLVLFIKNKRSLAAVRLPREK